MGIYNFVAPEANAKTTYLVFMYVPMYVVCTNVAYKKIFYRKNRRPKYGKTILVGSVSLKNKKMFQ